MKTNLGFKIGLLMAAPRWMRRRIMFARYRDEVNSSGEKELPQLAKIVRSGSLAIDVGANLGAYTYELSRIGARVIACEPNPDLANLLRSLRLPGVSVEEIAISDINGTADLAMPRVRSGHVLSTLSHEVLRKTGAALDRFTVATRRLDSLTREKVSFVKIDVEGHEEAAIAGASELIERDRPVLLVEIEDRHNRGGIERIRSVLEARGYSGHFYFEDRWHRIAEFDPNEHQNYAQAYGGKPCSPRQARYAANFLFVPSGEGLVLAE